MTKSYQSQIVGMHFRPPAKVVLEAMPSGMGLLLVPEPTNAYDEFAIQVLVSPQAILEEDAIDKAELADAIGTMGCDWFELEAIGDPIHLGYCISANNKKLGAWTPNTVIADVIKASHWTATLGFSPEGVAFVGLCVEDEPRALVDETEDETNWGDQ